MSRPWQPRPRRRPELLIAACGMAAIVGVGLVLAAVLEIRDQREWAALNDRMTAEQEQTLRALAAERMAEEIRFQQPARPAPRGLTVPVTFYGEEYRGRPMAYGGTFDPDAFTCAHRDRRMKGKRVEFTYGSKSIVLPVTDRGPFDRYPDGHPRAGQYRKEFDLSRAAFHALEPSLDKGVIHVQVRVLP